MELLDTNVIIRHIAQDHADHSRRVYRLFQDVDRGERVVTITEAVLVETVQVLSSPRLYALSRADIHRHLTSLLSLAGLSLPHKSMYLRALDLYATTNLDFVDCINVGHLERADLDAILSFDRDYDRVSNVIRREP
jgi:predicted nucleic-acid-binding protein